MRGALFVTLIVSIIAWASCQVQEIPYLSLGTPINDTVGANELKYYVIDIDSVLGAVTDREQQITFALTSYAGDADLFISTQGPPNVEVQTHECRNCILKGSTPRSEIQQIKKSSALFPTGTGQKFHIAVMGYAVAAEFTFNLFADRLTILDGFPQTGMSKASKYVYFEYTKTSDRPFKIVVTPFNGDPDLYVSQSKSNPTAIEHTWMSASTSGDIITIDPTKAPATSQNKYFIGVRAFFDSYYTVHVSSVDTYTKTIEGVAIFDRLEANEVGLFKVDVLKAQTVTIQTNPKSYRGDPDIYVSDDVSRFPPGPGHYLYARSTAGDDELSFRAEAKTYYIGIKAFTRATDFEIIVTGENHDAELVDGISQKHNITDVNSIKYFKYVHADPDNGVGFSVKPSVSSPGSSFRLYIAKPESGNRRPGPSKHDVEAAPQSTNPEVKTANWRAPSPVGTFFLGVQGVGSFDVAVNTNVSYTYLQESSTVYGLSVGYGFYKYFIFEADQFSTQDFSVAVNPSQGDVDIYVSTEIEKPTTSRYTWMSNGWNKDTVYVPSNDAKAKGKSRFYVGVYGASSSGTSYFNIVAFQSGSLQMIEDGVDARGAVGVQKYTYYKYTTPVGGSLTVSLKLTGTDEDADIYISTTTPKPSKLDYTYRSIDYGDDVIVIEDTYTTTYYIAVYGLLANADSGISYTLSVQQNYHTINVNSYYGGAMTYTPRAKTMQFKARIYSHVEQVLISLTLVNGRTRLYLNTNETDATNDNHQLLKWGWPSNSILITKDDPMFRSGLWSIGVDAFEPSSYYVTVSTPPSRTYLTESRPTIQAVAANSMNLYSYMVPYNASRLNNTLALRVMDGSVDLFVNYGYTIPTRQNHTLQVRGKTNALLILPSEEYSGLYLTIAAYGGTNPHNYFSLLLSTGNDYQTLLDDQPQEHQTRANLGYNRFQVIKTMNKTAVAHVSVGVESCDISPAPVAYLSETNKDVTESDKHASTFAVGSHGYVQVGRLSATEKGAKEPSFYVGVRSADQTIGQRYVIYTTTRDDHRPIRKDSDQLSGHIENDVLVVRMSNATVKVNYHKTLYYDLYMYKPHDQQKSIIEQSNMYTVCGIKSYGRRVATYSGSALPEIRVSLPSVHVSNSDMYAVSVVVHDGRGLESAYNPGFVVNGVFYPDFPGFGRKVSVGGILILVAALLLAIYLIAGMIFNFVKGERGIRVIPNFDFWRILPGLIKDGVMFIATCGKKSSDYGTLDLPTTFAPASVNTAQPTVVDKSSYGSI